MKFTQIAENLFEYVEDAIYILIALLLVATAIFLIINTFSTIIEYSPNEYFVQWVIRVLDKILLLMMIIEILYTVRISLRDHALSPQPFLIVGLIAAVRRILVISVESAYVPDKFQVHMIEIGVLGGLIVVFVGCIFWLKNHWSKTAHPVPER